MEALSTLQSDVVGVLTTQWIDASVHAAVVAGLLTARRRKLILVDCVSFEIGWRQGVETAFAFDRHFADQGFRCLPAPA